MSDRSSARYRALLDERSATLAERGIERRRKGSRQNYLVCLCGDERFGLPVFAAASVLAERPCTAVPGAPVALRGIICHSGTIISVIDLAEALQIEIRSRSEQGHFVRLRAHEPPVALAVDRVLGVARIAMSDIQGLAASETMPGQSSDPTIDVDSGSEAGGGLGSDAILGYAPRGLAMPSGITDGFSVIDVPRLLRRLLP